MKRRKFLGQASGLAALTLAGHPIAGAASTESSLTSTGENYDVIVVGGGFAGVTAARDCEKNGYRTLLLEARNRLGGRTWTTEFDGSSIEYGGAWVYNNQPFVWTEVQRYGLEIAETPGAVADQMFLLANGERIAMGADHLNEAVMGWMQYTEAVRSIVPRAYDLLHNREAALAADAISARAHMDSLELTPLQKAFCTGNVELISSGTAEAISYLDVLRFYMVGGSEFSNLMDSAARFKLKEGTSRLIELILEDGGADVKLSSPVRSIEDNGELVTVATQRGEKFRARAVVSTLPMNTMAGVNFKPALPDGVLDAARQRHPGRGVKIYLQVTGDVGNVATIAPGRPLNYMMTFEQAADHTLLVAFSSDPDSIDVYDDEALQKELQVHLPGAQLLASTHYDWNNDPYSLGTWATYRPGWAAALYDQFQRPSGRIQFASGDHGEGWRGTIDGAIGAGVRAAAAIHRQLA